MAYTHRGTGRRWGAAIIGEVINTPPNQVVLTSPMRKKQVLNSLSGTQLPQIC